MNSTLSQRFLVVYSAVVTAAFAGTVLAACAVASRQPHFDEIDVQRINVIEPDGKVRLVISNEAQFPGSFIHGKEVKRSDRQTTGMLFMNDEGTEMGGLIFGGQKDANGEIRNDGHLSFDQYDQDQIFSLDAGQTGSVKHSMMLFSDRGDYPIQQAIDAMARIQSLPASDRQAAMKQFMDAHPGDHERVAIGRAPDGSATLQMMDTKGRQRIVLKVADGSPVMQFLDENGKIVEELPHPNVARR